MLMDRMVDAAMAEFKQNFNDICADMDLSRLTPDLAEQMGTALKSSLASAGIASYHAFLMAFEEQADLVRAKGELFRFKAEREKCFLTPLGEMSVMRRCFQNKSDTKSHVPLDAAWDMERQYMTPQVREAVLFSCAHVTPEETAQLLDKCALFTPSATAIKHVVEKTGDEIEAHREALDDAIRAHETAPEGTQTLVASLDGATVLLNESGLRFGRPAERPPARAPGH